MITYSLTFIPQYFTTCLASNGHQFTEMFPSCVTVEGLLCSVHLITYCACHT